ncbi:MAG: hypothetical protein MZW92_55770 [Comamonadaceae bacterium]|nr:hypothetical protein [Comamonadaceae bacterium]
MGRAVGALLALAGGALALLRPGLARRPPVARRARGLRAPSRAPCSTACCPPTRRRGAAGRRRRTWADWTTPSPACRRRCRPRSANWLTLLASAAGPAGADRPGHRLAAGQHRRSPGHAAAAAHLVAGAAAAGSTTRCATSPTARTSPTPAAWPAIGYPGPAVDLMSANGNVMSSTSRPHPGRPRTGLESPRRPPRRPCPKQCSCDVAIVGSGAGGGITAELLSRGRPVGACSSRRARCAAPPTSTSSSPRPIRSCTRSSASRQDCRQGDLHPAGALRRRLDHGQLDRVRSARPATR